MSSPTRGMRVCRHGTDGRDFCPECYAPAPGLSDAAVEAEAEADAAEQRAAFLEPGNG